MCFCLLACHGSTRRARRYNVVFCSFLCIAKYFECQSPESPNFFLHWPRWLGRLDSDSTFNFPLSTTQLFFSLLLLSPCAVLPFWQASHECLQKVSKRVYCTRYTQVQIYFHVLRDTSRTDTCTNSYKLEPIQSNKPLHAQTAAVPGNAR